MHDRRRLHRLRASRDGGARHARAANADHDERRARVAGGERQADHLHAGAARPSPRADGRRLCRVRRGPGRRRRDRRDDRRAGIVVGRSRHRHGSACADRGVRRRHGARSEEVRRVGARRHERHGARRLRERLGETRRSTSPTRSAIGSGASASIRRSRSSTARCGRRWATSRRRASTSGSCWKVRDALDARGYDHVRIVVSGGFTVEKIRSFEEQEVPVDAYGVGSSLIRGSNDFTGDIVMTDGTPSAKFGRRYRDSSAARARHLKSWLQRHVLVPGDLTCIEQPSQSRTSASDGPVPASRVRRGASTVRTTRRRTGTSARARTPCEAAPEPVLGPFAHAGANGIANRVAIRGQELRLVLHALSTSSGFRSRVPRRSCRRVEPLPVHRVERVHARSRATRRRCRTIAWTCVVIWQRRNTRPVIASERHQHGTAGPTSGGRCHLESTETAPSRP